MKRNTMVRGSMIVLGALCAVSMWAGIAAAQPRMRGGRAAGEGFVNLPYQMNDSSGNNWMVFDGGWFRTQGNQPVYSQAGNLAVNNAGPSTGTNQARQDAKTGEIILEDMAVGNCLVTRRILVDKDGSYIRYIDIFKNNTNADQTFGIVLTSSTNYGINSASVINDTKKKDNQIGWVAMTGCNRAAVDMFAGKGAKLTPSIPYNQGNNSVQANFSLTVPAGQSKAIMHLHTTAATFEAGQQFIMNMKESKMMQTIPAEVRRLIVNFGTGMAYIGDYEILRGDISDVVELRSGDQMRGTIQDADYKLTTFYGEVDLPAKQIVGMLNVGQFRPRQLLVTDDGQVFGGKLDRDTISLELASGQVTNIPLTQITRMGYRKRPGEPEEWTFDKPFVLMRTGDRVNVQMPDQPIEVSTRYGLLKLDPASVASIAFQSEDNGVHTIFLTDGSKFAGLVNAAQFDMKLAGGTTAVKFPASSVVRLQLNSKVDEADDSTSSVSLVNDDLLVGSLTGALKLDTAFDTLTLQAGEIRRLAHTAPGSQDVQVTLWDNSTVSGQIEETEVQCKLNSGATIAVPLALVGEYNQPLPHPSAATVEKIKALVGDLNADDWKARDHAQKQLEDIGPGVISVLKEMRPSQPPEAQQRIDSIMANLAKQGAPTPRASGGSGPAPSTTAPPGVIINDDDQLEIDIQSLPDNPVPQAANQPGR